MIKLSFAYGDVQCRGMGDWVVTHPSNGAILAYCSSEKECNLVNKEIEEAARRLGGS